ncbi:dihydroneopterin aldolase [Phocicoccus pinnipedialis]|uniref:7,8-dihydroneopterin aldolase n=1 Tax=Phocicoccus pinnipedialis TaxID=110845 RepID=A0A6V7R3R6_9BACL|nr:dihydroneopterin aldolase [Jeotgalicoccus pinnipedialis]MBP1940086.1 dihydroneopterin aldolase [Jeotgalicoccus pinnipedialis]CAD2071966.1 Dihydroneopterin aldolase [Jeotgalicoccus pinnipedialis]
MDKIRVNGIKLYAYHGVLSAEREIGQYFLVDCVIHTDLRPAGQSDEVNDTINYADVYDVIEAEVIIEPVNLIEHLAEKIATAIFKGFAKAQKLEIKVTKPSPPIDGSYENVSVEIVREREN